MGDYGLENRVQDDTMVLKTAITSAPLTEFDTEKVLAQLTRQEKVDLLSGAVMMLSPYF
jgi:hypothetical protein